MFNLMFNEKNFENGLRGNYYEKRRNFKKIKRN